VTITGAKTTPGHPHRTERSLTGGLRLPSSTLTNAGAAWRANENFFLVAADCRYRAIQNQISAGLSSWLIKCGGISDA
jgi:hypothetical protein